MNGSGDGDSDLSCFVRVVVSQGSGADGLVVKCLWSGSRFRVRDEVACTVSDFDPRIDEFSASFMFVDLRTEDCDYGSGRVRLDDNSPSFSGKVPCSVLNGIGD